MDIPSFSTDIKTLSKHTLFIVNKANIFASTTLSTYVKSLLNSPEPFIVGLILFSFDK